IAPRFALARGAKAVCHTPTPRQRRRELQGAAWLSFATLAPAGQNRLLTAIEAMLDSIEARLHPLGIDLLDESPERIARREAPWPLPTWTAARSITRRCFVAGDSSLAVLVQGREPLPSSLSGFDPFSAGADDADQRLARFLCWPISSAVRIRVESGTTRVLRERCGAPASKLALVIDEGMQAVSPTRVPSDALARVRALQERLSHFERSNCDDCESFSEVIAALSEGLPDAPALGWLELSTGEALVVPRLSAVSAQDAFLQELAELAVQ